MTTTERNELLTTVFNRISNRSSLRLLYTSVDGLFLSIKWTDRCRGCSMGSLTLSIHLTWDELTSEDSDVDSLIDQRWEAAVAAEMKARGVTNKYHLLS